MVKWEEILKVHYFSGGGKDLFFGAFLISICVTGIQVSLNVTTWSLPVVCTRGCVHIGSFHSEQKLVELSIFTVLTNVYMFMLKWKNKPCLEPLPGLE